MEQTIEQRIGNFVRERRELREDREAIIQVLRNNGYENETYTTGFDEDINLFGKQKEHVLKHKFGKIFMDESFGRYALVPVHSVDRYHDIESEELVLVDMAEKKSMPVVSVGNRDIHYTGRCKLIPFAMDVKSSKEGKKAIIAYKFILHADLKDPFKVGTDVFNDYLFRYSENCVTEADLTKMKVKVAEETE